MGFYTKEFIKLNVVISGVVFVVMCCSIFLIKPGGLLGALLFDSILITLLIVFGVALNYGIILFIVILLITTILKILHIKIVKK